MSLVIRCNPDGRLRSDLGRHEDYRIGHTWNEGVRVVPGAWLPKGTFSSETVLFKKNEARFREAGVSREVVSFKTALKRALIQGTPLPETPLRMPRTCLLVSLLGTFQNVSPFYLPRGPFKKNGPSFRSKGCLTGVCNNRPAVSFLRRK